MAGIFTNNGFGKFCYNACHESITELLLAMLSILYISRYISSGNPQIVHQYLVQWKLFHPAKKRQTPIRLFLDAIDSWFELPFVIT